MIEISYLQFFALSVFSVVALIFSGLTARYSIQEDVFYKACSSLVIVFMLQVIGLLGFIFFN